MNGPVISAAVLSISVRDGVIKLCAAAGIPLPENLTPAEKLTVVQKLMAENDPRAKNIFETIGIWLGYTLKLYRIFYDTDVVLLLGRVVSGEGGNIILEYAKKSSGKGIPGLFDRIITSF